jgi:hypothetical protein
MGLVFEPVALAVRTERAASFAGLVVQTAMRLTLPVARKEKYRMELLDRMASRRCPIVRLGQRDWRWYRVARAYQNHFDRIQDY